MTVPCCMQLTCGGDYSKCPFLELSSVRARLPARLCERRGRCRSIDHGSAPQLGGPSKGAHVRDLQLQVRSSAAGLGTWWPQVCAPEDRQVDFRAVAALVFNLLSMKISMFCQ